MSLKQPLTSKISPIQQEYFQQSHKRVYKICNRYKIVEITLDDFGLKTDQGKCDLPLVWSHDSMSITTPKDEIKKDSIKPFCCTHCGNEEYIKYGKKNGKQIYICKNCNHRFVDNLFFERLKCNPKIICATLDLYFKGVSLRKITDHLKQFYDFDIHFTSVFHWINKYISIMDEYVRQFKPQLSDIWNVDEMMIKIDGDWFYLWNVIDDETRFHLASVISKQRTTEDARKTLITAKKRSHGSRPQFIITDGLQAYKQAINEEFHTIHNKTVHVGDVGIRGKKGNEDYFDNNLVERLHGTIRERNKTQRGLKDEYSAFIRGHQLYYNFIRPHQSLDGFTPSQIAGIDLGLKDNKWENLLMKAIKKNKETKTVNAIP
jgi:transposase-like protein